MDKKKKTEIWLYIFFILIGAFFSYCFIAHATDNRALFFGWGLFVPCTAIFIINLFIVFFKKDSRNSEDNPVTKSKLSEVRPATKSKQEAVSNSDENVKDQDDEQKSTNRTSSATEMPEQNLVFGGNKSDSDEPYTPFIWNILDLCTLTGARFADAKKALTEAKGDFKKAKSLLPSPESYTKKETAKKQPRTTTISELERIYENHQDNIGKHRIVDGMLYKVTDVETVWGDGEDHGLHLSLECISEDWLPYEYEIKDGEITIIKGYGPILDGELVIPATIEGCLVTRIQHSAFSKRKDLKSIKIPDTVKYIEELALVDCEELVYIESYESGKLAGTQAQSNDLYIEEYAFAGCKSLKDIGILDRVTHIDLSAVWGTNWLNNQPEGIIYVNNVLLGFHGKDSQCDAIVRVKEGTTIIAKEAFYGCTSLQYIIIPDSVIRIEDSAFQECSSLSEIVIPPSVTTIGDKCFMDCTALEKIVIPPSVMTIGEDCFKGTPKRKRAPRVRRPSSRRRRP